MWKDGGPVKASDRIRSALLAIGGLPGSRRAAASSISRFPMGSRNTHLQVFFSFF